MMDSKMGQKDVTQAVVLADDFTTDLISLQKIYPSVLLPIINIPLLDYLIETLINSKIQELFLYCSNHVDLLKIYVKNVNREEISVSLIISDGCRSLGDALRDIDTKGSIRGNFVLIRGDAFINADLKNMLSIHDARRKRDKGAAMTMIMRNLGSTSDSFLKAEQALLVSDRATKKLLHYSKLQDNKKKVKLELDWFLEHGEIDINTCYLDTHVYLCSPAVPPLFTDNFDFQTMEDFVRGVLMSEEILDSRIYWEPLKIQDYSLPIVSWKAYHVLSRDILQRHSFPLAPNSFLPLNDFIYMNKNTYRHSSTTLKEGCIIEQDSIVACHSSIGNNTTVTRSVIGDNCIIGANVTIRDTYILSNASIADNCVITNSILFANCIVKKDTKISGCIVCPDTTMKKKQYIDSILEETDSGLSIEKLTETGVNSKFKFLKHVEVDEYDIYSTDSSSIDENSERNSPIPDDANMFLSEVIDSLLRGYQDKLNCENLILEINSSRYAYNVSLSEVTCNVTKAILSLPLHFLSETKETVNNQNYFKNLKIMIVYFHPIIQNYIKTKSAQDDCLRAMEEVASTTNELLPCFRYLLHVFYDRDILSEDKILEWYESIDEFHNQKIKSIVRPFIKWLQEAEEDSTGSEDK